ncbi:MAG: polysaccharide deacetylase family protein [Reinekea sp.]
MDAGCKSLISICFPKIAGAPIGSLQFLRSKEGSMACALRRYGFMDSGLYKKKVYMFKKVVLCFVLSLVSLSTLCLAETSSQFNEVVELHRRILFLMSSESSNEVSQQRDTFIARNFYVQKRHILETLEEQVTNSPDSGRALVVQLMQFTQGDESHAADALAFIDLVDAILYRQGEQPFLTSGQLSYLHQLEQQMQLIQQSYSEDLAEITTALTTRGLELEPWSDYLAFLRARYSRENIYQRFNQAESELAEPATRGAESKKDAAKLVWGFGVPKKTVVLTFDDGPHYRNTGAVLDILKEKGVHGYFFAVGRNVGKIIDGKPVFNKKAELLKRALNEGHRIANHSYSHAVLTKLGAEGQKQELGDTSQLLSSVSGQDTTEYRPPYGSKNDALLSLTDSMGMRAIMWNIDSRDWADPVPASIVERVMAELEKRKKGILLFHDIHKQTVQALPSLLDQLKEKGYRVVTIDGEAFEANTVTPKETAVAPTAVKSQLYSNSWALVIGVNKYRYWPQLSYAVNDAQGVAEVLQTRYGFEKDHIFTLFDEKATRENIVELLTTTLADPKKVKSGDRVFVFYAGHGMTRTLPSGRNLGYIIPVDAQLDKFSSNSISMTHLQDFSDMIPAKHVYFVMDSCYSGIALTRGAGGLIGDSKYLSEISNRRARQILTAGGADQEVSDGGPQGHSIFTWSLLQGLKGEADLDGNQIITATELGAYVAPKVANSSDQTPVFGNLVGSEGGDFIFELALAKAVNGELTQEQKLKNALIELQKENAALKQQLALLQTRSSSKPQPRGGEPDLTELSPVQRKLKANELHEQGLNYYKKENYSEALRALRLALVYNPSNVTIVNDYGFVLYRDGQFKNALAWLEKTIEMDANRVPVYLNIADVLVELQREEEAVPYYQFYLELYPDSPLKGRVTQFLKTH